MALADGEAVTKFIRIPCLVCSFNVTWLWPTVRQFLHVAGDVTTPAPCGPAGRMRSVGPRRGAGQDAGSRSLRWPPGGYLSGDFKLLTERFEQRSNTGSRSLRRPATLGRSSPPPASWRASLVTAADRSLYCAVIDHCTDLSLSLHGFAFLSLSLSHSLTHLHFLTLPLTRSPSLLFLLSLFPSVCAGGCGEVCVRM